LDKKKKELPFEEDVDLEFEYKVFMILDKLKKYKLFIIGGFIALIIGIVAVFVVKEEKQKVLNEASKLAYQIKLAYESDNEQKANSLINSFKSKYSDTPFMKLVLSYELKLKEKKDLPSAGEIAKKIKNLLETKQLKSGYTEYQGYVFHEENKDDNALKFLGSIERKDYNFISAQLLTAFILKKQGSIEEAKSIFTQISQESGFKYFSAIARENL